MTRRPLVADRRTAPAPKHHHAAAFALAGATSFVGIESHGQEIRSGAWCDRARSASRTHRAQAVLEPHLHVRVPARDARDVYVQLGARPARRAAADAQGGNEHRAGAGSVCEAVQYAGARGAASTGSNRLLYLVPLALIVVGAG